MKNRITKGLCILMTLSAAGLFAVWLFSEQSGKEAGNLAAGLCLLLFLLVGINLLPRLMNSVFAEKEAAISAPKTKKPWIAVIVFAVSTRLLLFLIAYFFFCFKAGNFKTDFLESICRTWGIGYGLDAPSYLGIAENGYVSVGDARFHLVFLPLFPLLIRIFSFLTGEYLVAGFLCSNLCAVTAAVVAFELARLDVDDRTAFRAVRWIFLFPAAIFFCIPMTESLFLLLSLCCCYFARAKRFVFAGAFAMLASLTRLQGILLLVVLLVEFFPVREKIFRKVIACMLPVCGVGLYLLLNVLVSGNPFQFLIYQSEHWSQQFNLFFDTAQYETDYLILALQKGDLRSGMGLYLPALLVMLGSLLILLFCGKKLRPSYVCYFLIYYFVSMGASWLLSAPRYLAVAFPVMFAAAFSVKHKGWDLAVTGVLVLLQLSYLWLLVWGFPVY